MAEITAAMIMDRQQYQVKRSRSEPISLQGFLRPGSQPILTARTATGRDSAVSYTSIVPDVNVLGTVTDVPQNRTPFRSRRAHTFERVRESGSLPHVMGEHRQSPILTMGPQLPTIKIYPAPTVQRHVRLSAQPSEDSGKSPLSASKDVPHLAVITQKRIDTPPSQPKNRLAAWMSAGIDDPNSRNREKTISLVPNSDVRIEEIKRPPIDAHKRNGEILKTGTARIAAPVSTYVPLREAYLKQRSKSGNRESREKTQRIMKWLQELGDFTQMEEPPIDNTSDTETRTSDKSLPDVT
ncbi:Hypp9682 [Branchiostoma lanceolatum]|uniref:Hypp9682 protein n=1 Tax=Branchiostoma lanceolatum TaxID=7740 RepID=A0A8S4MNU7_BRALA|nr:Hypp9682 [Branchiostoma lanceolatum]